MRLIGHLAAESAARTFGDYLYVQGIANHVEGSEGGAWGIWVNDEDQLAQATDLLTAFQAQPSDPKFRAKARSATELRQAEAESQAAYRKRVQGRRHLFRPLTGYGFGPLTFALIVASVSVFLLSKFGEDLGRITGLFYASFQTEGDLVKWSGGLTEIRRGEIWRLFTPMLIHFNFMHIIFNMLWLRDLGSMIEGRQSSWHLGILVLAIAGVSNTAQFFVGHSPLFGGMSGVVYGLLGYIWLRGKFDPASGLFLHKSTVMMMLIWLVLCYTNLLGPVANTAHLAGLLLGMGWGYLSSLRYH